MDFHFTEYQATVESAVIALADRHRAVPVHQASFHLYGDALDEEIAASGFHQVLQDVELGTVTAVGVIMEIAKVPASVEIMASTLIRPTFCPDVPRPLALIDRPDRPVRFLPHAKSALLLDGDKVSLIELGAGDVTPVESLFAYPYGTLSKSALARAKPIKADANELRRLWQVGMAAEICGALDAALALTTDYVTQRHQFGKALGSFQAVQHRLAEVAVSSHAMKWLIYRAAFSGSAEQAALACAYAQDAARQACYDLHQFSGANGLTLEYSLHFWTYRMKALLSELGGAGSQGLRAADLAWGTA
ncbi:MAG TPA: acyl-CoA dehydrogenase family protein [Burkholderiales bacterium]|nr:acyl-CoA dehydrogenase family protein [Burkholderiales bacterium]